MRFTPSKHNPKEITIIIPFSKTNPHNDKLQLVHTELFEFIFDIVKA